MGIKIALLLLFFCFTNVFFRHRLLLLRQLRSQAVLRVELDDVFHVSPERPQRQKRQE